MWSRDMQIKVLSPPLLGHNFFTIQGSILLIHKQELKSGKVTSFFSKSTNLWKKIFISRHNMIIFIYKSPSVNSGWLILFVRSKVTRGDSLAFKMLLTIFSLQEQSFFLISTLLILFLKSEIFKYFLGDKSVLPSQSTLITENLLANCHFSKKDIL